MHRDASPTDTSSPNTGIGLRSAYIDAFLGERPPVPFLEVHAENHMGNGRAFCTLERIRQDYAVSIHGVGLSLGGSERPDPVHLARFAALVANIQPSLVSEHLAWCRSGDVYLNDLLPTRYDVASLDAMTRNVAIVQDAIGRPLLIENPSRYLAFEGEEMRETDFLAALCRRTGCGVLLDVNNVVVSARNTGFTAEAWLQALPSRLVGEIHLAGHEEEDGILIDTHGAAVGPEVWRLYASAIRRFGRVPTLIERDRNLPPLDDLLAEARQADQIARGPEAHRDAA